MKRIICTVIGWFWTLRYYDNFLLAGAYAVGHDLEYTGEQHNDHWNMVCKRCGEEICSEIGPDAKTLELK